MIIFREWELPMQLDEAGLAQDNQLIRCPRVKVEIGGGVILSWCNDIIGHCTILLLLEMIKLVKVRLDILSHCVDLLSLFHSWCLCFLGHKRCHLLFHELVKRTRSSGDCGCLLWSCLRLRFDLGFHLCAGLERL